ncbi:MAG: DegT/DnrJ/EryC1/StrS family aminotransferase [Hyphomicrobiaceae bacterium]
MNWKYALCEPNLDQAEISAAVECISSAWLSMGPRTRAFEEAFAELHGCKHAIAVSSGTAALHLAMLALDIGQSADDEVIQPSINFVAAANMTKAVGARPVFADIVSLTEPTIDPEKIELAITEKTRAIVVMHYGGYACRMNEIVALCKKYNLHLIEDACHAPATPAPDNTGQMLGAIGDIGCFSFFSNKNMTCGEGGMIVTDNDALAKRMRALRSHGMTTLSWERHKGRASTYDVTTHGFNYRIDDLRSAIGLVQLGKLPAANAARQAHAKRYAEAIARHARSDISYLFGKAPTAGSAHVAGIIVPANKRDRVRQGMSDVGIQSSLHYPCVHHFSGFGAEGHGADLRLSEVFSNQMITLPLYPTMPEEAGEEIVSAIVRCLDNPSTTPKTT